jgi:hypothetical protein
VPGISTLIKTISLPGATAVYTLAPMKIFFAMVLALVMAGVCRADAAEKLNHVVSFKFKSSATAEQIKEVEDAFKALKQKIKEIQTLEWGTNVSPEKLNKGFTHCWVLSFKSEKDRDAYLVHPDHKAFGKILSPVLDDVFVIDFLAKQ